MSESNSTLLLAAVISVPTTKDGASVLCANDYYKMIIGAALVVGFAISLTEPRWDLPKKDIEHLAWSVDSILQATAALGTPSELWLPFLQRRYAELLEIQSTLTRVTDTNLPDITEQYFGDVGTVL